MSSIHCHCEKYYSMKCLFFIIKLTIHWRPTRLVFGFFLLNILSIIVRLQKKSLLFNVRRERFGAFYKTEISVSRKNVTAKIINVHTWSFYGTFFSLESFILPTIALHCNIFSNYLFNVEKRVK